MLDVMVRLVQTGIRGRAARQRILVTQGATAAHGRVEAERVAPTPGRGITRRRRSTPVIHHGIPVRAQVHVLQHLSKHNKIHQFLQECVKKSQRLFRIL